MNFENKTEKPMKVVKSIRKEVKSWVTIYPGKTEDLNEQFKKSYLIDGLVEVKAIESKVGTKKVETKVLKKKK